MHVLWHYQVSPNLYVDEKKEMAKWVLMQSLGPWKRLVVYLSKNLD